MPPSAVSHAREYSLTMDEDPEETISITALKGILPRREKPVTIEEMNEAIAWCASHPGGLEPSSSSDHETEEESKVSPLDK
jgi:hypothetical protein